MANTKLSAETNHITSFDGNERFIVTDDPSGTPADGYTELDDLIIAIGLDYTTGTVTTGNVTGVEGTLHDLTIAGLTAERKFILPTPSAAGKLCGFRIIDGDADYSIMPQANSVDLDGYNLFIAGESLVWRSTGTGAADWEIAEGGDGRIVSNCKIIPNAVQSISTASTTKITFTNEAYDVGDLGDLANNRITVRRASKYMVVMWGVMTLNASSTPRFLVFMRRSGANIISGEATYISGNDGSIIVDSLDEADVGDYFELFLFQNSGSSRDTAYSGNTYPFISVMEQL